jgi:ribosomal protein S18 acetylase RimI-like enzyme
MESMKEIIKRPAQENDEVFARKTHHTAYHDVIVRQFGDFDEKMQDDFFDKSWKPKTHEILLSNQQEIGYCSIERFDDHIRVHELVLSTEFQGKGFGSKILTDLINEAKDKNVPIKLQVLKENQAQYLYRKLGFQDTSETDTHIQMEFNPFPTSE